MHMNEWIRLNSIPLINDEYNICIIIYDCYKPIYFYIYIYMCVISIYRIVQENIKCKKKKGKKTPNKVRKKKNKMGEIILESYTKQPWTTYSIFFIFFEKPYTHTLLDHREENLFRFMSGQSCLIFFSVLVSGSVWSKVRCLNEGIYFGTEWNDKPDS